MLDIGVIVAAVIFLKLDSPNRFYADPAVSLAISFIIFGSAIPMSKSVGERKHTPKNLFSGSTVALKSGRILLEASPIHLDLAKVKEDLLSVIFFLRRLFLVYLKLKSYRLLMYFRYTISTSGTCPSREQYPHSSSLRLRILTHPYLVF